MPPESGTAREAPHLELMADEPHPGCNCGRRRSAHPATPLLTDDLVIAARDRAREPELPPATLERALATPVTPRPARYDVIILAGGPGLAERDARIAAEFARHEHRVFHIGAHEGSNRRPTAPTLRHIEVPAGTGAAKAILALLEDLQRTEGLEATALFAPPNLDPVIASEARRWGWKVASPADAPDPLRAASDVTLHFDVTIAADPAPGHVFLSPELSWPGRWRVIDQALRKAWPRASVVVLTHDNLAFNRMCLASLIENTEYPNFELIVVDNASSDGTVEELRRLASLVPNLKVILNDHNAGFGPGNNQGLAAATGDVLVLLNNDTIVPRGWLTRLARHLEDPTVGLIGPATNRTCNEAQLDIPYQTYAEYKAIARDQGQRFAGERYPIRMPMFFCAAMRRDTYERLGPLDERYEVGMFEDEDYALRVKEAGLTVAWTPEVYVHHAYHASIGKLLPTGEYMRLVRLNQGRFEEKWGICWERHRPAPTPPPTA